MAFFIRCDCGAEGLYVEKDEDEFLISLFYCSSYKISIKHKLKWIWQIIKGKPYSDCVILNEDRMNDFLKNIGTL